MGAYFSICSIIYIGIFIYFFFSKQKVNNVETRVYKYFLITTLIGLIFDVLGFFAYKLGCNPDSLLYKSIAKVMLLYFIAWSFEFSYYIYAVSYGNNMEKGSSDKLKIFKTILVIAFFTLSLLIIVLPIKFNVAADVVYPDGFSVGLTYMIFALSIILASILSFINVKKIISKKYTPLYLLLVLIGITFFVQKLFPELFLVNFALTLIVVIMYFTIENPDLKLLRNYHEAKQYAEDLNIEKQMFVYNISQDMKHPLLKMSRFCEKLLYSENIEEYKYGIRSIKSECNSMLQSINGIFDIDVKDIRDLSTDNTKYNIQNLLKLVDANMRKEIKESGKKIEFISSISDTIPKEVMGDSTRLKEVLSIVFNNALKHTKEGYIEFHVSEIHKNQVCRLMITIEDSGTGIDAESLDGLFDKEKIVHNDKIDESKETLALAKKIINILGGNLIITSQLEVGTKVSIVLDQELADVKITELDKYDKVYIQDKKILLVGGSEDEQTLFMRAIADFGGVMENVDSISNVIEKLKKHDRYFAIIIDGDIPHRTAIEMLEQLKAIKGFNTPVIVLTKDKTMKSSKNLAILGFTASILRPVDEQDIMKSLLKVAEKK